MLCVGAGAGGTMQVSCGSGTSIFGVISDSYSKSTSDEIKILIISFDRLITNLIEI